MDQPSHSYGSAGTNRHEFFAPKALGALECGGLTPLSGARLTNGEGLVSFGGFSPEFS